jgi:hypothetical protein
MAVRLFFASYSFVCGCGCKETMEAGTECQYNFDGKLVSSEHAVEENDKDPFSELERAKARKMMCPKCFLVHAGLECY